MEYCHVILEHNSKSMDINLPLVDNLDAAIHGFSLLTKLKDVVAPSALDSIKYRDNTAPIPFNYYEIHRLDALLCCCYRFLKKQAGSEKSLESLELLENKINDGVKNKKKLHFVTFPTKKQTENKNYAYEIPIFAKGAHIDLLYKVFNTRSDNQNQLLSFVTLAHQSFHQGSLSIEDYMEYEYRTCINLAIEITSAYLQFCEEMNAQEPDPLKDTIVDLAFADFSKNYLPFLVCSPHIYTRNIFAHRYFRQLSICYSDSKKSDTKPNTFTTLPFSEFYTIDNKSCTLYPLTIQVSKKTTPPDCQPSNEQPSIQEKAAEIVKTASIKSILTLRLLGFHILPSQSTQNKNHMKPIILSPDKHLCYWSVPFSSPAFCNTCEASPQEIGDNCVAEIRSISHPLNWPPQSDKETRWTIFCNPAHNRTKQILDKINSYSQPLSSVEITRYKQPKGLLAEKFSAIYRQIISILEIFDYNI